MYPRLFALGPLTIPAYGALAAVGLVAGLLLAMRVARSMGLNPDAVWDLGMVGVGSAFAGSRLLVIAANWHDFLRFPLLMLSAGTLNSGWTFYCGLGFALVACVAYAGWKRMPLLRTLDATAPGLALGHAILMLAAFAAGSAYGSLTDEPWGVTFHSKYAALWSGTPLGVRLQPTQLYEAASELVICAFLLWLLRPRHGEGKGLMNPAVQSETAQPETGQSETAQLETGQSETGQSENGQSGIARKGAAQSPMAQDGEVFGAWLFLLGVAHFVIEFYRADPGRGSLFGGLMSVTQGVALIMMTQGALLWLDRRSVTGSSNVSGSGNVTGSGSVYGSGNVTGSGKKAGPGSGSRMEQHAVK